MPQVRSYGARQVSTRPLPSGRQTVAPTPESFGAGFGRTLSQVGAAVADVAEQERRRADDVANDKTRRAFNDLDQQLLYSQDKGLLKMQGLAAQEQFSGSLELWDQQADMIAGTLKSDAQRQFFENLKGERRASFVKQGNDHAYEQLRVYDNEETEQSIGSSINAAIAGSQTPDADRLVASHLADAEGAIERYSARYGRGPEFTQAQIAKTRSQVYAGVVEQQLAVGNDRLASQWYAAHKDDILGSQRAGLEAKLELASNEGVGLRTSVAIWEQLGPKNDLDPVDLDAMEQAARAQLGDDPKALKATVAYLRERKVAFDASRADRLESAAGSVWTAAANGASLAEITRMPAFMALPGRMQATIRGYVVDEAYKTSQRVVAADNRAYTLGQRDVTAENQAYTRAQRADAEQKEADAAEYYRLSKPENLKNLTEDQIQMLRGRLHGDWVNKLLEDKRKVEQPNGLRAATLNDAIFEQVVQLNDFPAAAKGTLKAMAIEAIDAEQQANGNKELTLQRKKAIVQELVDQKVMVDGYLWNSSVSVAEVINSKDQDNAYVPIASIPPAAVAEAVAFLKQSRPAWATYSDARVKALATDQIERWYAAGKFLKLGDAEATKRLLGQ